MWALPVHGGCRGCARAAQKGGSQRALCWPSVALDARFHCQGEDFKSQTQERGCHRHTDGPSSTTPKTQDLLRVSPSTPAHTHTHTHTRSHMYAHTHPCTLIHMHTDTHARTCTQTPSHTHSCTPALHTHFFCHPVLPLCCLPTIFTQLCRVRTPCAITEM